MKLLNQNTRIMYDKVEKDNQVIYSEAPMKYITSEINQNRYLEHPSMMDVKAENQLRSKPTHLNEIIRDNVILTGTAPYRGLHDGPVDKESELLFGEYRSDCLRPDVIEYSTERFLNETNMKTQVPMEQPSGISTRNIYRNKCFKNNI